MENVTGHDTVKPKDMKQQVQLLQNENNGLRMETESILKVIELFSVRQINTREINANTENFITVKDTSKSRENEVNHQQDYRIPLSNAFETLPIEECQDKPKPTDEGNSVYLALIMPLVKEDRKNNQLNTTNNQRLTLLTTNMRNPLNGRKHI